MFRSCFAATVAACAVALVVPPVAVQPAAAQEADRGQQSSKPAPVMTEQPPWRSWLRGQSPTRVTSAPGADSRQNRRLQKGDCILLRRSYKRVPCDRRHDAEIAMVKRIPRHLARYGRRSMAVVSWAQTTCEVKGVPDYLNRRRLTADFLPLWLSPTKVEWRSGDRRMVCFGVALDSRFRPRMSIGSVKQIPELRDLCTSYKTSRVVRCGPGRLKWVRIIRLYPNAWTKEYPGYRALTRQIRKRTRQFWPNVTWAARRSEWKKGGGRTVIAFKDIPWPPSDASKVAEVAVGENAADMAVSPDGSRVYLLDDFKNSLTIIDAATKSVAAKIDVAERSTHFVMSPAGDLLFVSARRSVDVIDTASGSRVRRIPFAGSPADIEISPDGSRIYVVDVKTARVRVIDTATGTALGSVKTRPEPGYLAITPDGSQLYAMGFIGDFLSAVDTGTLKVVKRINIGIGATDIAMSPDGSSAYITDLLGDRALVIDTASNRIADRVRLPYSGGAVGVAFSPDGATAYTADYIDDHVTVIDVAAGKVASRIEMTGSPHLIAVSPDGTHLFVAQQKYNPWGPGRATLAFIAVSPSTA